MSTALSTLRITGRGLAMVCAAALATTASAQVVDQPPNLQPLPAANVSLVKSNSGTTTLRFSTTSWNSGTGPLQLEAGAVDTGSGKQRVDQRVFLSDGSSFTHFAGYFEWHPAHNHFHFDNYALYTLQPVNAPGGSQRIGSKTTFCIMDTNLVNPSLPGAPATPVYSTCGQFIQGMSIGWGDTYGSQLAGQEIDFTDNADGIYQLKIEIDPKKVLIESNKNDNISCVLLDIRQPNRVSVLDASGSCATVTSITPDSAPAGGQVQVTIKGFGFAQGMSVTFEGGNGPRPVASNVVLVSDTETEDIITATVTVPSRKPGKDPLWDLHVGGSGLLPNAFRVTP